MNKYDLQRRTKSLAIEIIKFLQITSKNPALWSIAQQLIRSSTSVGANYRAVCRAKSLRDFVAKLSIVEEEADESIYWLEILEELLNEQSIQLIVFKKEMNEILSIIVASKKTVRNKLNNKIVNPKS